jgi:hypothetical protein
LVHSVGKRLAELGIRIALSATMIEALRTALARPLNLPAIGSAAGLLFGLLVIKVLAFVVDQATRWTPVVLAHVVLARLLLGLLAT